MNFFGGDWTENKIEILVEYAAAYLKIMGKKAKEYEWKLLYFDGFAGTGFILKNNKEIIGAANRILELNEPVSFDWYYFVEKDKKKLDLLKESTKHFDKNIAFQAKDCNEKIEAMSNFLNSKRGKKFKVLAYIDPCGMQLNWNSLEKIKDLSVDAWILIPTGMGVNRLLKKNGLISDVWIEKLQVFLGISKEEIMDHFYSIRETKTLFGEETVVLKEEKAIQKSEILYRSRLNKLFTFVSESYPLRNSTKAIMFHFLMVSNNKTAVKIANDIISKYKRHG